MSRVSESKQFSICKFQRLKPLIASGQLRVSEAALLLGVTHYQVRKLMGQEGEKHENE